MEALEDDKSEYSSAELQRGFNTGFKQVCESRSHAVCAGSNVFRLLLTQSALEAFPAAWDKGVLL